MPFYLKRIKYSPLVENDCAPFAISCFTGEYEEEVNWYKQNNPRFTGVWIEDILARLNELNYSYKTIYPTKKLKLKNIVLPKGYGILITTNHAIAFEDQLVYDTLSPQLTWKSDHPDRNKHVRAIILMRKRS